MSKGIVNKGLNKQEKICYTVAKIKEGRQRSNEKAELGRSTRGDRGYAAGAECMVSTGRSAVYHADSGHLRGDIICKGGNVRKRQGAVAEKCIKLENGIPDACTFRNAIKAIDTQQLHGTCYVCEDIGWLEGREKWSGLAGIGVVFCKAEQAGKVSKQAHYFIL